jgi:hypothetical protein
MKNIPKDAINYLPREDMKKSLVLFSKHYLDDTLRWTGRVAHRREIRNELNIFVVKRRKIV